MWKNMNIPDQVIDNNIGHYRKSEETIRNSGKLFAPSWNWSAFLFTLYWLVYRRCYKWAAIIYGGLIVASGVLGAISGGILSTLLPLAFWVCSGLFGDSLYFYAIKEKIYKLKQSGLTDIDIINKTKPSWTPVIIILAISIGLGILFAILMATLFAAIFAGFSGMANSFEMAMLLI